MYSERISLMSNGSSDDGPGCSGMCVPVEENAPVNNYCGTNLASSRDDLTEFGSTSHRLVPKTPPSEREEDYHMLCYFLFGGLK